MNGLHHTFQYPVAKLLESLQKNRETHLSEYKDALSNYKKLLVEELEKLTKDAKDGKKLDHEIPLRRPESHGREYDQAITMLQMTSETEIMIDGQTFAKLVMDDWDWQHSFTVNTKSYTTQALSQPGAYASVRT